MLALGTPNTRFSALPMNRPRPAPAATSTGKCAPRYTRDRQTAAASAQGRTFHQPFEVGGHQRGDREDHHGMTGGTAQPVGRGLAAQDHIRQGFRWPVTPHDHLGHRLHRRDVPATGQPGPGRRVRWSCALAAVLKVVLDQEEPKAVRAAY